MSELLNLRTELSNDGRLLVLADIPGSFRVLLGTIDPSGPDTHYRQGGADRVAKAMQTAH